MKLALKLALGVAVLLPFPAVTSQDPDYSLTITDGTSATGLTVDVAVLLDVGMGAPHPVSGWSYAVCTPQDLLLQAIGTGSTTETVNGGSPPDFELLDLHPEGFVQAIVISFNGSANLGTGTGYELAVATYELAGIPGTDSELCFCDTTMEPMVITTIVDIVGDGVVPIQTCGIVTHGPATHVLRIPDATAQTGDAIDVPVLMSFPQAAQDVVGWQYGVCHGADMLLLSTTSGTTTQQVQSGAPPDFEVLQPVSGGFIHTVAIDFEGVDTLRFGTNYEISVASYELLGPPSTTNLCFCDSLPTGDPQPTLLFVFPNDPVVPTQICGSVITELADYVLKVTDAEDMSGDQITSSILLDVPLGGSSVASWNYGVCSPPDLLLLSIDSGSTTMTAQGGLPPDFEALEMSGTGFTHSVVIDFQGVFALPTGHDYELAVAAYQLVGDPDTTTQLCFCDDTSLQTQDPAQVDPTQVCGTVIIQPEPLFMRGDCNSDGLTDVSDPIYVLDHLFLSTGAELPCPDSCDGNDSGSIDLPDAIGLLGFLFNMGFPPAPPVAGCGPDPTQDSLDDCLQYDQCP